MSKSSHPTDKKTASHKTKSEAHTENLEKQEEFDQLKDQLLRALADAENTRRRASKDREEALKYASANFARDILSVSDNLRRALESIPKEITSHEDLKAFIEGVEITEKELIKALEKHGIKEIHPRGEKFNSELHEAIFEVPTNDHPVGTVVEVMQPGYTIHNRLLRPAMVGVAKEASKEGE